MTSVDVIDPRVEQVLRNLTAIPLETHRDVVFKDQEVSIDGRNFVNCSFHRCRMVLLAGLFQFVGKADFVDCSWGWGGLAKQTIELVDDVRANELQGPVQ